MVSDLPAEIAAAVAGWQREPVHVGMSGAYVFRLCHDGQERYLKSEQLGPDYELRRERDRLAWLADRLPVPRVLAYAETGDHGYLLTTAVHGRGGHEAFAPDDGVRLARVMAAGLRQIHAVPVAGCPFDASLPLRIEEARSRLERGVVDAADFEERYQGWSAADLFTELLRRRPAHTDRVFTHGDYCLPNILINEGRVSGFIDWGRAGVADRYQDLALAARSLAHNGHADATPTLFNAYGINEPDAARIEFYILLDEFF